MEYGLKSKVKWRKKWKKIKFDIFCVIQVHVCFKQSSYNSNFVSTIKAILLALVRPPWGSSSSPICEETLQSGSNPSFHHLGNVDYVLKTSWNSWNPLFELGNGVELPIWSIGHEQSNCCRREGMQNPFKNQWLVCLWRIAWHHQIYKMK